MDPFLVILAGGASSRMKQPQPGGSGLDDALLREAQEKPKSMISVGAGGRPLMDYLLYNAREAGYDDIVIVVGEHDDFIRRCYGEPSVGKSSFGIRISYALQKIPAGRTKPLGTADALLQALRGRPDWKGKKFTVCNSDNLYSRVALRLLLESPYSCAMIDYDRDALRVEPSRIEQFAVIQNNAAGFLTDIIEKPSREEMIEVAGPGGRVGISMNIFRFSYDLLVPLLKRFPLHPVRREKELPLVVKIMAERNPELIKTIPLAEYVPDLTSPGDILKVREYLLREYPDFHLAPDG